MYVRNSGWHMRSYLPYVSISIEGKLAKEWKTKNIIDLSKHVMFSEIVKLLVNSDGDKAG